MIPSKYRATYAEHASAGAIAEEIKTARKRLASDQQYLAWLIELSETRAQQIANGTWPPAPEGNGRG